MWPTTSFLSFTPWIVLRQKWSYMLLLFYLSCGFHFHFWQLHIHHFSIDSNTIITTPKIPPYMPSYLYLKLFFYLYATSPISILTKGPPPYHSLQNFRSCNIWRVVWTSLKLTTLYLLTGSISRCPLRSDSLVCIENHLYIVEIGPILNKELEFIFWSDCSDYT